MKKMENQLPPQYQARCRALENYELCPSSKKTVSLSQRRYFSEIKSCFTLKMKLIMPSALLCFCCTFIFTPYVCSGIWRRRKKTNVY